jgi:hypothetical protein
MNMGAEGYQLRWTEDDFQSMCWHDNCVHGIRLRNPSGGYDFDLELDIDYIVEWICDTNRACRFAVAPATLTFHNVNQLVIDVQLSYKESLTIAGIEREEIATDAEREVGLRKCRWNITLHSYSNRKNRISFESTGFLQVLRKPPVVQSRQELEDEERSAEQ